MGLVWSLSAAIATIVLLAIVLSIYNKAKNKKDSPLYAIAEKAKGWKRKTDETNDDTKHYKRLSHRGGIKWVLILLSLSITIVTI